MNNRLAVNWENTLTIWWSFIWRTILLGALLGGVLGFFGGVFVGVMGRPDWGGPVGAILGYLGSIPVSIYVMRKILQKPYKIFSIWLVYADNAAKN